MGKYKEELSYHEDTAEDVQEVYPQEVMEPDFEEESIVAETFEEETVEDKTEDAADQKMPEEVPEETEKPQRAV